jgi:hypothetical protein
MVKNRFIFENKKTAGLIFCMFCSIIWCMNNEEKETEPINIPLQKVIKNQDGTLNWVPFDYNKHFSNMSAPPISTKIIDVKNGEDGMHSKSLPKLCKEKKQCNYQKLDDD